MESSEIFLNERHIGFPETYQSGKKNKTKAIYQNKNTK